MTVANVEMCAAQGLTGLRGAVEAARRLPKGAPLVVMLHGYRYAPGPGDRSARDALFALAPQRQSPRIVSWPARLGAGAGGGMLAVGFGWPARGSLWQVAARTGLAGRALAAAIDRLSDAAERPVGLIGHSMGADVAFHALPHLAAGRVGRIVALSGAAFADHATRAMATPAGQAARVLNVTSTENAPFDRMLEIAMARGGRRSIGGGLDQPGWNWTDLRIDRPAHRDALAMLGHPIPGPGRAYCHWSTYLRPGLLPFYAQVLDRGGDRLLDRLAPALRAAARVPAIGARRRALRRPTGGHALGA